MFTTAWLTGQKPRRPIPAEFAGSRGRILTQIHEMTERRFSKEKTRVFL